MLRGVQPTCQGDRVTRNRTEIADCSAAVLDTATVCGERTVSEAQAVATAVSFASPE